MFLNICFSFKNSFFSLRETVVQWLQCKVRRSYGSFLSYQLFILSFVDVMTLVRFLFFFPFTPHKQKQSIFCSTKMNCMGVFVRNLVMQAAPMRTVCSSLHKEDSTENDLDKHYNLQIKDKKYKN